MHDSSTCLNPLASPPPADRILVVRLGAVGDVIRTLPAAARLRAGYPGAHFAWLVEPAASSILRAQPWIDEVLVFPRNTLSDDFLGLRWACAARGLTRFTAELRRRRFDLVVDFHSILRSGVLSIASGSPNRVALSPPFGREFGHWLASQKAKLRPVRMSRYDRNAGLVDYLAVGAAAGLTPLQLSSAVRRRVAAQLEAGAFPAALHPGTSDDTPYKRYTAEGYAEVAKGLAEELGAPVLVTWGPSRDDRQLATSIVAAAGGAAVLAPPTPTLEDLAALFGCCRLFIGADSGPLHLASLVGTPVVQILGPTDSVENAPYIETPSRTVRVPIHCSPCRRGCAAATCMRSIEPAAVLRAARELLAESVAEPTAMARPQVRERAISAGSL